MTIDILSYPLACRRRGSAASRKPSPTKLNDKTASVIASPGNVAIHGATSTYCRPSARMLPQLGVGGSTPRPRKLNAASDVIAPGIVNDANTTSDPSVLGSTWR